MRFTTRLHAGWTFLGRFSESMISTPVAGDAVRLPHNAVDLELGYFDERSYQHEFGYQRVLPWQPEFHDREVSLEFEGAMANATVWANGCEVVSHKDGYTPFSARLTGLLRPGDNLITVRVDGSENPAIPPFGGQIDYLTYAGIYRDVWLKQTDRLSIHGLKIETGNELSDRKTVRVVVALSNHSNVPLCGTLAAELCALDGTVIARANSDVSTNVIELAFSELSGLELWDLDAPCLYLMRVSLDSPAGRDMLESRFGFRRVDFAADGFSLNGRPVKLRGLNRHQSYPYVGYAMGSRVQRKDADILKFELKCNVVRTSHYPQSVHFLDRCDEIGLLVLEEIPGWQHIGGAEWQDESIRNVRRMIERDWNHASIFCWGVRINESADHHDFYARTAATAKALDRTRPTGGIRCIENSELLEDVYTMNDFFNGAAPDWLAGREPRALRSQRDVTGLEHDVPYLVTEHTGHMFPTKRIDCEHRQAEHVTRHLQVLDAAYGDQRIAGAIGWCMFDYNTHKDFGAGDRICHHGVMDFFRVPKFAAYAYASQCSPAETAVLEPVTYWARGERDRCEVLPLIVLTNCDYVELKVGDFPAKRAQPARELYPHLPHPPVIFDGRHVNAADLGAWGMVWRDGVLTGYVDGKAVATVSMSGNPIPTSLCIQADDYELLADEKDATRVVVKALDQTGRLLPFLDDVAWIEVTGAGRRIGPRALPLRGGVVSFWVETTGPAGEIAIDVGTQRLGAHRVVVRAA